MRGGSLLEEIIISNNPKVAEEYQQVRWIEGEVVEVLTTVRDLLHKGHELVSHPLPPSLNLMSSPVRSVLMTQSQSNKVNSTHLEMLESSIHKLELQLNESGLDHQQLADYILLDYNFISSALE